MKYCVSFKKEESSPGCHVHISTDRLMVFKSFFCGTVQYISKVEEVGFWEFLNGVDESQSDITGNSCSLTDAGEGDVILEDIFWDIATKLLVNKKELISAIEQWVAFCNDYNDRSVVFESIRLLE